MRGKLKPLGLCFLATVIVVWMAACQATPAPVTAPAPTAASQAAPAPVTAPTPAAASKAASAPVTAPTPAAAPKATTAAVPAPDRVAQLYELAKKEGEVVFNLVPQGTLYDPLIDTFKKRFPQVNLKILDVSATRAAPRIISEVAAKAVTIDVHRGSVGALMPLLERGLLEPTDWTGVSVADPKAVLLEGRAIKIEDIPWIVFYNDKLVSPNDIPKSWEDLLAPKWTGKIAFRLGGPFMAAWPLAWGEKGALEYVNKLANQKLIPFTDSSLLIDKVVRGEASVGMGIASGVLGERARGAPLAIAPVSPQTTMVSVASVLKGAPHPNAARLLMAWLATKEAKEALAKGGLEPTAQCTDSPTAKLLCDLKIKMFLLDTMESAKLDAKVREDYPPMLGLVPR
ncbi:MAG: extracellular solute-binding protein [Chloroflexi bacterium]|nr:extracellular solute-binding protein [Chloroflexota bacterium]